MTLVEEQESQQASTVAAQCYEGTAAIDELLATLTMDELRGLCHTKSDQRRCSTKQDMIRHLVKQTRTQTKLVFQSSAKQRPAQLSIDKGNGLDVLSRKSLKITGGLIRICAVALEAFGRLHTVRYRYVHTDHSTMLSSSLLAAFGLRRYPDYVVKRSCKVFMDRAALLAYEEAVIIEQQLHELISENTPAHLEAAWQLCQGIEVMWDLALVEAMVDNHYSDNNYFLARFSAGWIYTAVMEHGAELLGRLRRYEEEVVILRKLLDQRSYKLGSRGNWYERLALIHDDI
ncbi:hypothetical protein BDF22DRAFT_758528 [Syncephalis plumigaleata]|nr:hypothetical protein BDF22DRAFT_758528 [Syncephalis plumigaleata]